MDIFLYLSLWCFLGYLGIAQLCVCAIRISGASRSHGQVTTFVRPALTHKVYADEGEGLKFFWSERRH